MPSISLKVNGHVHTVNVDPQTPLLYVLSDDLELRGPKFGCGLAQCGACTVILRGQAVRSCVLPISAVKQQEVTTLGPGVSAKTACDSASVYRRGGGPMRLLPERRDAYGKGAAR
jgi:aerobic-type carbon monoxide dehydrogenase small subunit (CoxS/CutS family)